MPWPDFGLSSIIKRSNHQESQDEIIVTSSPPWSAKGYPYLEKCGKDRSGIAKKTGLQHVYEKMTNAAQVHVLKNWTFMCSPTRNQCFHFWRFRQSVPTFVAKRLRNLIIWVPAGARRWKDRGLENTRKTLPNKLQHPSQIRSFHIFESPPEMACKASPNRAQDTKACQHQGPEMIFCDVVDNFVLVRNIVGNIPSTPWTTYW